MSGRAVTVLLLLQIVCSFTVWSMRLPSERSRLYLRSDMDQGEEAEEDGFQNLVDFEECAWTKCSTFQDIDLRRICLSLCQKLSSSKPGLTKRMATAGNPLDRNDIRDNMNTNNNKQKEEYLYRRQLHNIHSCIESLCSNKDSSEYHVCVIEKCYGHLHFGRSLDGMEQDSMKKMEMQEVPIVNSYPMISDTFLESRKVILPGKRGYNDENRNCLKSCNTVDPLSLDYEICVGNCQR